MHTLMSMAGTATTGLTSPPHPGCNLDLLLRVLNQSAILLHTDKCRLYKNQSVSVLQVWLLQAFLAGPFREGHTFVKVLESLLWRQLC